MDFNKVIFGGRLTRDVELRHTPSGEAVANMGMAANRKFGDKEKTVFTDVVVWGKQAEVCAQYLSKGSTVLVDGELSLDQWEDKESGKSRSKLFINANRVEFVNTGNKEE